MISSTTLPRKKFIFYDISMKNRTFQINRNMPVSFFGVLVMPTIFDHGVGSTVQPL